METSCSNFHKSIAVIPATHKTIFKGIYKMENETEVFILLKIQHLCPLALFNSILQEALFIAPAVPQGALLTTRQLCGEKFWAPLSEWHRTLAGSCMDHLVAHGHVPFEYVPRTGRNPYPLQFRIKDSYKPN